MQELLDDFQKWRALREGRTRQLEEQEQAKRRQIQELLPLPRRVVPLPWEDLASVITRAAQVMGYPQPDWILRPEKAEHSIARERLPLLARQLDYDLLGRLLNVDEELLHDLTLHRFTKRTSGTNGAILANIPTTQGFPRLTRLPRLGNAQHLFAHAGPTIQVCPACLGESGGGYDRLYWRAAPVLICSRHQVWLIDTCPMCSKPIPTLRPKLSTCPTCGADYRQWALPLAAQASWLRSTHHVFLTHLGIDTSEFGEPFPGDEPSPLQDLAPHEYFWIVTEFLEILLSQPYRERLLPFLLRTLPVEDLVPSPSRSSLLLLHYLLARWPLHFWILLERLQLALEEDDLWFHSAYAPAQEWEAQLNRGDIWYQGISKEQTMAFLRVFFKTLKDYFQQHRQPRQRSTPFGKRLAPVVSSVIQHPRSPRPDELVSPQPWEDLASVINRSARNMGSAQADWVLISPEAPHRKVYSLDIPLLRRLVDYQVLERQLCLDERSLYQLTLNRCATQLQAPQKGAHAVPTASPGQAIGRPLLSHSAVRRIGISLRDIKLCPACLEEEPGYDRLFWRLRPVILCPHHTLLLIDRCPLCHEPIPGLRPASERCPYCQRGDYRQILRAKIPSTSLLYQGQLLLLNLLTTESTRGWKCPSIFGESPILRVEPWQYFALWERFENLMWLQLSRSIVVQSLKKLAWNDDHISSESPLIRETSMHMVLFHFLLASWPENLIALLDLMTTQLRVNRIGGGMNEQVRETDQLVQHIWSASITTGSPFAFLLHMFEALHLWAIMWKEPENI